MSGYIGKEALGQIADGAVTSAKMDTNIAVSGTLQGTVVTATTGFAPDAQDGAYLGTSSLQFSDLFLADAAVVALGDDGDVTLTHVPDTGILLNGAMQLQFSDASQFINAPSATVLDINATDEVEINATLADVNANLDVSGTFVAAGTGTITGVLTTGGGIISDTTNTDKLGSTSVTWADAYLGDGAVLAFGEDQDVTLTHVADTGLLLNGAMALQFSDSSQYINAPSATVLDITATDEVELNATLVDINANVEISGTATTTGVHTFTAVPVLPANTIDSAHYTDGSIDNAHIADDQIDSEHYADGSIDLAHMSSQSVDEDNLYISNAGSNDQFLQKQSGNSGGLTWASVVGTITALNNATANELVTVGSTTTELDAESLLTFTGTVFTLGAGTSVVNSGTWSPGTVSTGKALVLGI